jgi:putative tricarboxylic transport membrane protein
MNSGPVSNAEGLSVHGGATVTDGADPASSPTGLNVRGLLVAGVVAAVGGATIWASSGLNTDASGESIGPSWWPSVLGGLLVLGAVAVAITALRHHDPLEEQRVSAHGLVRLAAVIALIVVYGIGWHYFHFVLVTSLFLSTLILITGGRGVKALLVFPLLTTAVLYGLFAMLLRVPL